MGVGFYGWIRENVKRAVLLGLSDAVEQLGPPDDKHDYSPQLLAVLRREKALPALAGGNTSALGTALGSDARPPRKRLGRTFSQLPGDAPKSEA